MAPCEELGYEVGDKFIVADLDGGYGFTKGSIIVLEYDDRSSCPCFRLLEGSHTERGRVSGYMQLDRVNLYKETENKMSLKIGDKIKLNPDSEWADGSEYNPLDTLGVITRIDPFHDFFVEWSNGETNSYYKEDLIKQNEEVIKTPFPNFPFKLRNGDKPEVRQWLKDNGVVWASGADVVKQMRSVAGGDLLFIEDKSMTTTFDENWFDTKSIKEIQLDIQPAKVVGYSLVEKVENKSEKELKLEELIGKLSSQLEEAQTELKSIK
jgi:hypothetical protein